MPSAIDHTPHPHPASPTHELPESFVSYRKKAQQHGPLGGHKSASQINFEYGTGRSGASLGPIEPVKGQFFDREELPARFRRTRFSQVELDAVESGGASLY